MKAERIFILLGISSFFSLLMPARGNLNAVNWGGNYVSSTQTFTDLTGFSTTNPIMSTGASYSGTSAIFYGGAHTENVTFIYEPDEAVNDTGIVDNGNQNEINFSWVGNSTTSAFGEVIWQQPDFLNGASSGLVQFDASSNIFAAPSGTPATTRFIVEDGNTFYISNLNFTTPTTLTDPDNNTRWATYSPSASPSSVPFDAATATFAQHTFTDVEAIGYYFDSENNSNQQYNYAVNGFSSQVEVVPEPSTWVMLVIGGAGLLIARRRVKA